MVQVPLPRCPVAALIVSLLAACHHPTATPASADHHSSPLEATEEPAGVPHATTPTASVDSEPKRTELDTVEAPSTRSSASAQNVEPDVLPTTLPDPCAPRESLEQALQDLRDANETISRAGEHPTDRDLARIIPRLQRAAYAGDVEAQARFGNYVVGYYLTDEMFWPNQRAVAIAALAMLRVAARRNTPDPDNSLMVVLARDKVDFSKASGVPRLPQAWVEAAIQEAKRWEKCTPNATQSNVTRTTTPCPALGDRDSSTAAVDGRLAGVKRGWSAKRVLSVAGKPTACRENKWYFTAGQWSGPEVTYTLTFENGIVTDITRSAVGCRI